MKKLLVVDLDYDCGCVFFDEEYNYIKTIDVNDANWRREYFDPILEHYGIKVEYPQISEKVMNKIYKDYEVMGLWSEDSKGVELIKKEISKEKEEEEIK